MHWKYPSITASRNYEVCKTQNFDPLVDLATAYRCTSFAMKNVGMAGILQMDFAAASDIQRRLEEVLTGKIFSLGAYVDTLFLLPSSEEQA